MIFYFSATGNCKYVTTLLSQSLDDNRVYSILDCLKNEKLNFEAVVGESVGFVTPTYFWGLPEIVIEFIRKANIQVDKSNYLYHIATYGTSTGKANAMMAELLSEKGIELSGRFGIKMVDTWTPVFNLTNQEKIKQITDAAKPQVETVVQKIKTGFSGNHHNIRLPNTIASIQYKKFYSNGGGDTGKFIVEDSCIGCGLCEKKCPSSAIQIENKKPVWIKDTCNLCLGCLHRCPKFAIQYGRKTKRHGQFQNPYEKV